MPRYVILEHDYNGIHYDLMLENGAGLVTWRMASPLTTGTQMVTKLPDHRLDYLTYEGEVSGHRGRVRRVSAGGYSIESVVVHCWDVLLHDNKEGKLTIRLLQDDCWLLEWCPAMALE